MSNLSENWITSGLIDFEYKSYELLGYLQHVNKKFCDEMLYPELSHVVKHYNNLVTFKNKKEKTEKQFSKYMKSLDLENLDVVYESAFEKNEKIQEIESIIDFAIPKLFNAYKTGNELYEELEDKISVTPIGLIPLDLKYGYLFLTNGPKPLTDIYEYQLYEMHSSYDNYLALKTNYISTTKLSIVKTYEHLKLQLLHKRKAKKPMASYLIESKVSIPYLESFSPLAKRKLMQVIQ